MIKIAPQKGTSFKMTQGERLRVTDPHGLQVSDLFCFDAENPSDGLSSGRSIDYNDTVFLTEGHTLYSNSSKPMLRILSDSCGRHDFLMTPCSLKMFQIVAGNEEYHPSCHENLVRAFESFQIEPSRITTTFNIFMRVDIEPDGKVKILPPESKSGDSIIFEALCDLIVGLTACSHEETNAGKCKSIEYELIRA